MDHIFVCSQADFVSELFEADVAIFPGPVWLVAHEMPLEPRPVNGPVAAEVTLKRMLVRVVILEVNLAHVLLVGLRVRIKKAALTCISLTPLNTASQMRHF